MATKKAAVKKVAKKIAVPSSSSKLSLPISAASLTKAASCIAKNGKATFRFKEISVTKIPKGLFSTPVEID
jgi:hypothetical protein